MPESRALTITSAFLSAAASHRRDVAITFGDRALTYAELEHDSARLANALVASGNCEPGDRIGLIMGNRPEFLVGILAIARAGLVAVPIPPTAAPREVHQFAEHSGMRALLVAEQAEGRLADQLEQLMFSGVAVHGTTISFGGAATVTQLLAQGPDASIDRAAEDDPFIFHYTSGTTGRPKAVVVSHRARTLLALMFGHEYGCYTSEDIHLITTPMYHGAGLARALAPLLVGGSIELHERFDAEQVATELTAGRITATFMVPTMFVSLFELPEAQLARGRGNLPTVLSNASALPEHLKHRILDQWPGIRLFEIYGSTECGTVSSLRPSDQLRKQRCVGLPVPLTDVRIVCEDGREAAVDEVGTLYSSSPYLAMGYHDDQDATDAARLDGYVTAGDLARRDADGYLYIVGRTSDVIISGGVNVYPREVEEYLMEHPAVREAVVVGVSDPRWGESVHAIVVPSEHVQPPTAGELLSHCKAGLAPAKVPKNFSFRTSLPRNSSGKVVRRELLADLST